MTATSFDQLLRASRLASPAIGPDKFMVGRSIIMTRADRDRLVGKVKEGRAKSSGGAPPRGVKLSRRLDKRTALLRGHGNGDASAFAPSGFDTRQRVVVKVHYFNHASGGGAGLNAHARYVARDAATRDDLRDADAVARGEPTETKREAELQAEAHAAYLSRGRSQASVFYDSESGGVDGAARAEAWARSDKRHFRVVLSAENGAKLTDLPAYTREVMARAGASIGTKLHWIAVDHHDTDNPHTHIIIRGRRANGQDLVLPKDFVKHGFRGIARDVATEWLGARTAADERQALDREVTRHAPTRLDRMIEAQLPQDRTIRIAGLAAPGGDPSTTLALKERARELQRMGLAQEVKRNVLAFQPDWRDRLQAMELHLDIRKRVVLERTVQMRVAFEREVTAMTRGLLGR
ncbi:relaxase/mobilization nuclease domain-containing protein [Terricaulis sp.]|uniref:relaxase/mobilization nuclease domain-containing protein n=1 Tax=Terricaulis sp. TaxID=2768686 RepID=UPI002AC47887|nr:hypothetical protein [Terricaulis sp.]MDZ4689840.1 hypothetical protein [Terricaulis sp.]